MSGIASVQYSELQNYTRRQKSIRVSCMLSGDLACTGRRLVLVAWRRIRLGDKTAIRMTAQLHPL